MTLPFRERARRTPFAPSIMCALILLSAGPIQEEGPWAVLWTAPAILGAAMVIAWGAEAAQFFIAQGFALAILAWLQTLPEFAVEAVLAWKQQTPLLLANLTGALRLLTGFGWPMIYFVAAFAHRRSTGKPLRRIVLEDMHSVEIAGLCLPVLYMWLVYWKATLDLWDAIVLVVMYVAYLAILTRVPPEKEGKEELGFVPKSVVDMAPTARVLSITALFGVGGALIYFAAEPFLGSLLAIATALGVPNFLFIQWVAPFVSEFPEKISAFHFARTVRGAPMALMNMVSSNINQWTLLAAMLPIVFSISLGRPAAITFDEQQRLELLMTLGQQLVGILFLVNMELLWWEAAALFLLFMIQFVLSAFPSAPGVVGYLSVHIHDWVTKTYYAWAGVEIVKILLARRKPAAFSKFAEMWRMHVLRRG